MNQVRPWQRLTWRIPIVATLVLFAVVGAVSWAAYVQLTHAAVDASQVHILSGAREVAAMLDTQLLRARRDLIGGGVDAAVRRDPRAPAVKALLDSVRERTPTVVAMSVWSEAGVPEITVGDESAAHLAGAALEARRQPGRGAVGPLSAYHDTVVFAIAEPVRDAMGKAVAFVVATRRLGDTTSADAIGRLLGKDARLLVGNTGGGTWTDLVGVVPAPPLPTGNDVSARHTGSDGRRYSDAIARLSAAPWTVAVELPLDVPLATARGFLTEFIVAGSLFALAGGAIIWWIVGRVMNPLDDLRRAAELIADGRWPDRLDNGRRDEIGGLARTFDLMAQRIRSDEQELMARAEDLERRNHELRESEEQLMQAQKMEAVGRLAGGIAHDFNNLLTVINTYAEFTLSGMPRDDARRADVEEIRRAATSAAKLTRQMLAFSRKQVLAPRMIDLNESITGLTGMLQRVLSDDVKVVTRLRADLGPIWADAGQVEQVLMNLAVNARDAMPNGGTLTIETDETWLDEGTEGHRRYIPAGHYVRLAVTDTGSGMSDDVKAHIFEPFFTTKGPGEGTGLGLATVYGIVKQSGGYIWVYSEPGRGSSFKIFFPRYMGAEPDAPPAETGEYRVAAREAASILLVEDDASVRAAVRRIFERSPHRVIEAASGREAIEAFNQHQGRFDLVVTDMVMPGMTGAELIRELRERNPELRAVIMSGYSEETTSRDWKLPPNSVFLEKPISPGRLLSRVDELLTGIRAA